MKAPERVHEQGRSLWLDPRAPPDGDARAVHQRARGDGSHLQPDDLRPCDQDKLGLRRRDPHEERLPRPALAALSTPSAS